MKPKTRKAYWPPTYPGLETPDWLYLPRESYPPDLPSDRERLKLAVSKEREDEQEES